MMTQVCILKATGHKFGARGGGTQLPQHTLGFPALELEGAFFSC